MTEETISSRPVHIDFAHSQPVTGESIRVTVLHRQLDDLLRKSITYREAPPESDFKPMISIRMHGRHD